MIKQNVKRPKNGRLEPRGFYSVCNRRVKSNVSRFARKSSLTKSTLVPHLTRGRRSKKIIKPLASFEVVGLPRALRPLDSLEAVGAIEAFTPIASLSILD